MDRTGAHGDVIPSCTALGGPPCSVGHMRVALDEQIFLLQTQGGISRYFVELIRNLPQLSPTVEVSTPFRSIVNRHALESLPDGRFRSARGPFQPYPGLLAAATRPRRREVVDLIHHTFYHPRFLRDHPGVPKVVTIYDMIPEMVGAQGRFGGPHMAKREYVRRADLLLFISASARDDLVEIFGEPSAPCVVTPWGSTSGSSWAGPGLRGSRRTTCSSWGRGTATRTSDSP